jgi:energy-coupling factor transporter ATP-binding protein EcfA2
MPLYKVASEILESDIPFPELPASLGPATLIFNQSADPQRFQREFQLVRTTQDAEGNPWATISKLGSEYLLEFPGHASFLYEVGARLITALPAAVTEPHTLRHLALDHVLPLVFNQRGKTVFHSSAVVAPGGGALVFLGQSGSGKSTLAAALCQAGCQLLTDDYLVLQQTDGKFLAVPAYPGLRLWETSTQHLRWEHHSLEAVAGYTSKKKVDAGQAGLRFAEAPASVEAIYLVNQDWIEVDDLRISRVTPVDGLLHLVSSSICLDPQDRSRNETDFRRLSQLNQQVPLMHLRFPYDLSRLGELCEAVLSAPSRR